MFSCIIFLQAEEARIAKEVEAHEKRIRKELEKQDILRRKVLLQLSPFPFYTLHFVIAYSYGY